MKDCDIDSEGEEENGDTEEGRDDSNNAPCNDGHTISDIFGGDDVRNFNRVVTTNISRESPDRKPILRVTTLFFRLN